MMEDYAGVVTHGPGQHNLEGKSWPQQLVGGQQHTIFVLLVMGTNFGAAICKIGRYNWDYNVIIIVIIILIIF